MAFPPEWVFQQGRVVEEQNRELMTPYLAISLASLEKHTHTVLFILEHVHVYTHMGFPGGFVRVHLPLQEMQA